MSCRVAQWRPSRQCKPKGQWIEDVEALAHLKKQRGYDQKRANKAQKEKEKLEHVEARLRVKLEEERMAQEQLEGLDRDVLNLSTQFPELRKVKVKVLPYVEPHQPRTGYKDITGKPSAFMDAGRCVCIYLPGALLTGESQLLGEKLLHLMDEKRREKYFVKAKRGKSHVKESTPMYACGITSSLNDSRMYGRKPGEKDDPEAKAYVDEVGTREGLGFLHSHSVNINHIHVSQMITCSHIM
jgi:hypothetical protein